MQTAQELFLTESDYLAMEESSDTRHEYMAGQAYAMAGGTQRHNRIALNIASVLLQRLNGRPCQVFMSDVRLYIARDQSYYYPDIMVACGQDRQLANDSSVISDPLLVVEVLSPSTETIDRREKLAAYRRLPSVQEYVLVSQEQQYVEIYRRKGEVGWIYVAYEPGDNVHLASIDVEMPLAELYAGTDMA